MHYLRSLPLVILRVCTFVAFGCEFIELRQVLLSTPAWNVPHLFVMWYKNRGRGHRNSPTKACGYRFVEIWGSLRVLFSQTFGKAGCSHTFHLAELPLLCFPECYTMGCCEDCYDCCWRDRSKGCRITICVSVWGSIVALAIVVLIIALLVHFLAPRTG